MPLPLSFLAFEIGRRAGVLLCRRPLGFGFALAGMVRCNGQTDHRHLCRLASDPSIGRAEALRRAIMAMLDPKNPPKFAHPLAWAPFVLAGEGGAGR